MRGVARWVAVMCAGALAGVLCALVAHRSPPPGKLTSRPSIPAPEFSDSFGDGTPDFLRLRDSADRDSFRRWFTVIAESQYYNADRLPAEINDCAALLRFSYREALRPHDSAWMRAVRLAAPPPASEVRAYRYPNTPLHAAIFRVRDGEFEPPDVSNGAFAEFADAKSLRLHNSYLVARDLQSAQPGDVLFFRRQGHDLAFHAMIFLGWSRVEPAQQQYVVYHTGPRENSKGEIRRLSVAELLDYPDARWRPVVSNPAFLGVYRWNILRGDD
jgi:uncharacterized protein YfaT (DUF1175 family)